VSYLSYGLGLLAIRVTTADIGGFSLFAVLVYVADEGPAAYTGAGAAPGKRTLNKEKP
jgi:hypothetical protein